MSEVETPTTTTETTPETPATPEEKSVRESFKKQLFAAFLCDEKADLKRTLSGGDSARTGTLKQEIFQLQTRKDAGTATARQLQLLNLLQEEVLEAMIEDETSFKSRDAKIVACVLDYVKSL